MWLKAKCGHVDVDTRSHVADWNFCTHPHADEQVFEYRGKYKQLQDNRRHACILLFGWCGATFPEIYASVLRRTREGGGV